MNEYRDQFIDSLKKIKITNLNGESIDFNDAITNIVNLFDLARRESRGVFFIGNGGSAGIAVHMTADYLKNGGMRSHSLYEACTLTCLGNDFSYDDIFSKQLELLARDQDILVAISSSGNSTNIIKSVMVARSKNAQVITLSGFGEDNQLRKMGDYNCYVPVSSYGIVESNHNFILQMIVDLLMDKK